MLEKGSLDSMEGIEDVGRPLLVVVGQIEIENRGRWRTAAIDLTVAPGYWKKRKKKIGRISSPRSDPFPPCEL